MRFIIHANSVDWQQEYLPRFVAGLAAHGHQVHHRTDDVADETGVNVIFANNSWKLTHQQCINKHIPLITVGRCFFGSRFDMVAVGWDGFNAAADFCLSDTMPTDRWNQHGFPVPGIQYRPDGYVLVCGEYRPTPQWINTMREVLAGEDVRFRSHPFKSDSVPGWMDAPAAGQDDIESVLEDARVCISYDSISGCDAVLNGVASITSGKNAMARDVSWNSWREFPKDMQGFLVEAQHKPLDIWANRLAYCQWSHAEIERGDFWTHLEQGLSSRVTKANRHMHLSKTTKMRQHHRLLGWLWDE